MLLICAPFCKVIAPIFPAGGGAGTKDGVPSEPPGTVTDENRNCASRLFSSPCFTRLSLIGSDDATSARVFTCEEPPKMMPFWLITYTCPCAVIDPRICDGTPEGSLILLNAIHCPAFAPPAL